MKVFLFLVLLGAGCWFLHSWLKRHSTPEKLRQDPLVHYADNLSNDVKKAEAARDKANAAVRQEAQSAQPAETPAP